ncbi:ubiquinone biosynthesis monooxygenase COQ6, mitochondrial isoform X2 [Zophobas morio]|uniref:ubiquinone biosynthesis monooxygenase COQ6, mitochondrial isoform X2 n=1 Tax=Zophobas morio TaxID=2755281 RepID=UPI00308270EC
MLVNNLNRYFLQNLMFLSKRLQSTQVSSNHYDIIVAGGGMVGTTLACTLGKNPKFADKKILLLESSKKSQWRLPETYSNRVSALNAATVDLLKDIDAWKHISGARFGPVKRMQVWDASSEAAITFENDGFEEPVAYIVENDLLLDAVRNELQNVNTVEVVYQAKVESCRPPREGEDEVNLGLENGTSYTCDLLLGCDGANSLVRKEMDFHHIACNYNQMGIVATLKLPEDSPNVVAWQRHLPDGGFLALLPLTQGFSSMVWSMNAKEAKRVASLSEDAFVDAINDALWKVQPRSGFVDQATQTFDNLIRFFNLPSTSMTQCPPKVLGCDIKSRAMFPLGIGHATNYVSKGVALVGDAAHRVHPLAGQGVNLGFGDVICLNKVLAEAVYAGSTLGNLQYLKNYETERQRFNVPMILVVHGLVQLYSTQFTPVVILRSLGLQATNALTPLKKFLMSQAAGLRPQQA